MAARIENMVSELSFGHSYCISDSLVALSSYVVLSYVGGY